VMPTRIALGEAATWEVVASIAISVGSTAAVIPIATTIYSRALLRSGRVRIRQVLRPDGA
jgi:ABC-2 type transport system permease protein